ncbi:beta strand repeat-containing protein [Hymenobacter sp. AT01-02]|uniref:beta strand repeat-containing protein n=1 Tax=Hymenobacter sp. AT01-02 TaxID=1571877 RepID=UPI000A56A519|nr:hypothetical protein [Hymenobacter sp. AT01-02]
MKNKYLSNHKRGHLSRLWVLLVMLLALPSFVQAQITPNPSTTETSPDSFGEVQVGLTSSPKQYSFTGANLTGNITVSFSNAASFEGSTDGGTSYSNSLTLPSAGGNFLVRFRPSSVGETNGQYIQAFGTTGGRQGGAVQAFIDVKGTGVAGTPTITVNPTALGFGNQVINTTSSSMSVAVTATSLTAPVVVTAPTGFSVSATANGTYNQTLSLAQDGNGAVNTTIYVAFTPTAARNYVDAVTFTSQGATTRNVSVSGTGVLPPASLSASPRSLSFGQLQAEQVSTPQSFTVTGSNITSDVTVTAPNGFEIRVGTSGAFVQTVTLTPTNNTVNTALQARFAPATGGTYNSNITIATTGNGGATALVAVTGEATPRPTGPFISANPTSLDFGTVSSSGSAQVLSFTVNAGNLTTPLVLTGSRSNIVFRDATAGGNFTTGPLTIAPSNGTVSLRTIEVQLAGRIDAGPFSGDITASSTGATNVVVTISANSTGNNSVINASGVLAQFSTVPGVASSVQSYLLSGTNLLQDITVTAPLYFQVSLEPNFVGITTTGNSIVVPRNTSSGDVAEVSVYVRFLPDAALTTSSLILNASAPAVSQGIPVAGTSEPSIELLNGLQEIRNVIVNTTSASQALIVNAQRVLQPVVISKSLSTNPLNPLGIQQFELSLDNVNFASTVTLTPDTVTYTINRPVYVRYRPTYLGTAQSTLQFQSNDFSNRSTQSFASNGLLSGRSIDNEPTLRSTPTVSRTGTSVTVSFAGLPSDYATQGYGEGRIIVASTNPELAANNQPQDGRSYQTGNQVYGRGDQIFAGYYVVYAGPNQSTVIEGFDPGVTYYFYTFEYNNIDNNFNVSVPGAENYLSPPVPNTIPGVIAPGTPLPVTLVSFDAKLRSNQVAITWKTASELNNKSFEVQRSSDAKAFETILSREGKGTTNTATSYNAIDTKPLAGTSYYRLKQIDVDGTTHYTAPVAVTNINGVEAVMYPNPVENVLTIQLGASTEA